MPGKTDPDDLAGVHVEANELAKQPSTFDIVDYGKQDNPGALHSDEDDEEGKHDTSSEPRFEFTWLNVGFPKDVTQKQLVIAFVLATCFSLLLAVIVGVAFNVSAFDKSSGVSGDGNIADCNLITIMCASWSVAWVISILRFFVRYFCHPRLYGIYVFAMYWIMGGMVFARLYEPYYHPGTMSITTQATRQILNLAGNTLPWNDSRDATALLQTTELTWIDAVSAADFYNWLKQPMRYVVTGMRQNYEDPKAGGNLDYIPTLISNRTGGYAVWHMVACELRQVRTLMEPLEKPVVSTSVCAPGYNAPCSVKQPQYTFNKGVPVFENDKQDKTVRYRHINGVYQPMETYLDNKFTTVWGVERDAKEYAGFYYNYPGKSGQRCVGHNRTGVWVGDAVTPAHYLDDVAFMEKYRWIDEGTALVQMSCVAEVPTQNLLLYFLYSAEFTSAGLMRPSFPYIGTSFINLKFTPDDKVDVIALFAWYYFIEELQDLFGRGWRKYLGSTGMTNFIDNVTVIMCLTTLGLFYDSVGWLKGFNNNHFYSQMATAQYFQWFAGWLMFFVVIKGTKFARNIPVMRTCGDTMSACKIELLLFTVMLLLLLLAFAFIFNSVFSTRVDDYATLGRSLMSLFRGMVGDMDYDDIYFNEPVMGPFLYMFYLTAVLFVGFTILIAVISAGYDRACAMPVRDGMVTAGAGYLLMKQGKNTDNIMEKTDEELIAAMTGNDEEEEEDEEDERAAADELVKLKSSINQMFELINSKIEQNASMEQQRMDFLSQSIKQRLDSIESRIQDPAPDVYASEI